MLYICYDQELKINFLVSISLNAQINEQGVTRNFYAGNKLPIWYEEIPAQNSLLDTANEVEPMAT